MERVRCEIGVPRRFRYMWSGGVSPAWRATACISAALLASSVVPVHARDQVPTTNGLSYLSGYGPKAYPVVNQLWGVIAISLLVVVIVSALVLYGVFTRRNVPQDGQVGSIPLSNSEGGLWLIYIGSGITFLVLLGTVLWGYFVLAGIAGPKGDPALTVKVTGHQWWWEAEYLSPNDPDRQFTTANEIHIPVGKPVRVELRSDDVIHSFWVPALAGKMDMIPTQENETWLQADKPGIYRGQCTEYCGRQHAHMGFLVVAEPPGQFKTWWDRQISGARQPPNAFMQHCAVCHSVRGTPAQGKVGPDLSHLMGRRMIAAGTLPNTVGFLSGWILDPQRMKPGNEMPTLVLTTPEVDSIRSYLLKLR